MQTATLSSQNTPVELSWVINRDPGHAMAETPARERYGTSRRPRFHQAAAIKERSKPSVKSCLISRRRPAPSASRIVISWRRSSERASKRLLTFAQAIKRTKKRYRGCDAQRGEDSPTALNGVFQSGKFQSRARGLSRENRSPIARRSR